MDKFIQKKKIILSTHNSYIYEISMVFYRLKYQASERLHEKFTNFVSKNKAAQIQQSGRFALAPLFFLCEN